MAINLSSLSQATTTATGLSNLILVTPKNIGYQPQNPPSNDGATTQQDPPILFHYEGEQSVTLQSDITDHFVEDNKTIQDQIALKPETITTHGFIGELNNVVPDKLAPLKVIADKLTVISAYTPVLSASAIIAYDTAAQVYATAQNVANSAVAAWGAFTGLQGGQNTISGRGLDISSIQNKQQKAFGQFYGYWSTRRLFTVQTPWAIFEDMAIQTLRAVQDAETRVITDFEVTFKRMRFANTLILNTALDPANFQGRSSQQASDVTNLGTSTPVQDIPLSEGLAR